VLEGSCRFVCEERGGVSTVLFGLIAVTGAGIWVDNRVDFTRAVNLFVAAVTLIIGARLHPRRRWLHAERHHARHLHRDHPLPTLQGRAGTRRLRDPRRRRRSAG